MDATLVMLATTLVAAVTQAYIDNNIRELETQFEDGLTSQYYTDPFDEIEDPYPAQKLAALRCFISLYQRNDVWIHVAAPMQSGKTGVMVTLTRLAMYHRGRLNIEPRRMFVFTGMSDNDWRKQTKGRFPTHIRSNVFHRNGVKSICQSLRKLRGADNLRDVLLFIDESHIATNKDHTPRLIYTTLCELCPRDQWAANNIRIVTVSATDPAKVITIRTNDGFPCRVVRLETNEHYQSVEKLVRDGRLRPIRGNAHTDEAIDLIRPVIEAYDRPRYHIIRAAHGKALETKSALETAFPDALFEAYDSNSRMTTNHGETNSEDLLDINTMLKTQPVRHTFIIIKNAFYAAKTLDDQHVGVLYDRQTDNDSAVLQGLAGRACGYGKSRDTVVFTVQNAIERYLKTWRALCLNIGEFNITVEDGYVAPAQVMNLAVEEDALRVGQHELNPFIATDDVLRDGNAPVPRARAELVPEHLVEFFPVGTDSISAVVARVKEWIRTNDALTQDVKNVKIDRRTTNAFERHRDADGRYQATLGNEYRVRTLGDMRESRQNMSAVHHPARLQPCYDGHTLGLALRYLTGRMVPR